MQILSFNQSMFPRISRDTLLPVTRNLNDHDGWYPPGHGDVYESLYNSGHLAKLLEQKKEWVFIANVDNLGATVDLSTSRRHAPAPPWARSLTPRRYSQLSGGAQGVRVYHGSDGQDAR